MFDLICRLLNLFLASCDGKTPRPCLPLSRDLLDMVPVTVWIGDWGPTLDDVFEVWLDDTLVLTSTEPVVSISNTFLAYAGVHTLRVVGRTIPDDNGTYELQTSNNMVVTEGPPLRGSGLGAGDMLRFIVFVLA